MSALQLKAMIWDTILYDTFGKVVRKLRYLSAIGLQGCWPRAVSG